MNRRFAMRWKLSILLFILSISACSPVAPTETFPELILSPTLKPPPATATRTLMALSATPSPIPASAFTATLPPVISGSENDLVTDENRIQFPAGGTWVKVGTYLEEGESIEYVLTATQGQVMSLSIEQSWFFTLEVSDDTSTLTEPNHERSFWRGALPASGDYFITVNAQVAGDFTLRVAINPPGHTYQYFDYTSPQQTATLRYPDEFAPTTYTPAGEFKGNPALVLQFIRLDFYSPNTNLLEAYFLYSEIYNSQEVETCTQPLPQLETINGQKTFNGIDFTQSEAVGVAAGNIYDQVIYRTVYNNVCYEMVFFMHSGNIGNYTPGTVEEFDRAALLGKFEGILSTFRVP
jgi:hypothetical protein